MQNTRGSSRDDGPVIRSWASPDNPNPRRFFERPILIRPSCLLRCAAMLLACLAVPVSCLAQADYAREQRWADEIAPAILVGDPVYLEIPSGRKFLTIYAPAPKSSTGVIVVHGIGVHPDWGLISPLDR